MHMLQRAPYWAWITIGGDATDVYDVRHSGNLITCWIPSEAGKVRIFNEPTIPRFTLSLLPIGRNLLLTGTTQREKYP